jgi:hypothetical protein
MDFSSGICGFSIVRTFSAHFTGSYERGERSTNILIQVILFIIMVFHQVKDKAAGTVHSDERYPTKRELHRSEWELEGGREFGFGLYT